MKHPLFFMLFTLTLFSHVQAQNIDSFTVSDNAPNVYDSVYLINLSTNYTSLEWIVVEQSGYIYSSYPNDSIVSESFNKTGCFDISLVVGRDTIYDTITKICAVQVFDREPPTITLIKPVDTLEVYSHFIEPGFAITDNYCISLEAYISGHIDSSILGLNSYKIWAVDCEGNSSDTLTQYVRVLDQTAPVIEWTGENILNIIGRWDTLGFNPLDNVIATDNYDTNLTVQISGTYFSEYLKGFELGFYNIQFDAVDLSGNKADSINIYVYVVYASLPETPVNALNIYPNPNSGQFTIKNKNPNQILNSISIYNQIGQVVYFKEIDDQLVHQIEIDLQQPAGLYFILVKSAKSTITYKVLLE